VGLFASASIEQTLLSVVAQDFSHAGAGWLGCYHTSRSRDCLLDCGIGIADRSAVHTQLAIKHSQVVEAVTDGCQ